LVRGLAPDSFLPPETSLKIKQAIALIGLIAAVGGVSPRALAQDSGWYTGASAGWSSYTDNCPNATTVGVSCDDSGGAYSVFGGYQFIKYFGVELGYVDLGKAGAATPATGVSETVKARGFELLGVGAIPIGSRFEIYAKAGVYVMDVDYKCSGCTTISSLGETASDLTYGLGAIVSFSKNFGLRLQYQRYQDVGFDTTIGSTAIKAKGDIDAFTIGLIFRLY
jgi:OOP family OmpA-OmpF porin